MMSSKLRGCTKLSVYCVNVSLKLGQIRTFVTTEKIFYDMTITQRIHVWNIYLHLVDFRVHVGKYAIHGSYVLLGVGFSFFKSLPRGKMIQFDTCCFNWVQTTNYPPWNYIKVCPWTIVVGSDDPFLFEKRALFRDRHVRVFSGCASVFLPMVWIDHLRFSCRILWMSLLLLICWFVLICCTLPETNSSHLKRCQAPKGNDCLPTIHFQVL